MTDFRSRVLAVVAKIPMGKTMTYKQVAATAGNPGVARAVGSVMKTNFNPEISCHRVVRSDGKPGGYNRGVARKIERLHEEGAIV